MTSLVSASQGNPEGPNNPQELGHEWYCPACRALVADDSVTYGQELHRCGTRARLLSPDEIVALDNAGQLSVVDGYAPLRDGADL